jgi:uncharacterized protein
MQTSISGKSFVKILIDITHPAHVHFFKNAALIWKQRGHDVRFVARDKEITIELLKAYNIHYEKLSRIRKGLLGLSIELIEHDYQLYKFVRHFKPDIMLNIGGTFIVHVGKLLGIKTCVFTDTEHAKISNAITFPFANWICTPESFMGDIGGKHITYNGFQELAYLHPNYFNPQESVLSEVGIGLGETFFIVRFVSWGASHDVGKRGLLEEEKLNLVRQLENWGRVLITSEAILPKSLEPYQITINPIKIHDLLYFASFYIGEGATMATESALLGTPSIYINELSAGTIDELDKKYGLVFHVTEMQSVASIVEKSLFNAEEKKKFNVSHRNLLNEKIDVTAWMVQLINNIFTK